MDPGHPRQKHQQVEQNRSSNGRIWTNEKHMHFLSAMEATFVRRMLLSNNTSAAALDRRVPDISESTRDIPIKLAHHRHTTAPRCTPTTGFNGLDRSARDGDGQRTRHPSHAHQSPQDQVVPQLMDRASDKAERNP